MSKIKFFNINDAKKLRNNKIYLFGNGDIATKTFNKIKFKNFEL